MAGQTAPWPDVSKKEPVRQKHKLTASQPASQTDRQTDRKTGRRADGQATWSIEPGVPVDARNARVDACVAKALQEERAEALARERAVPELRDVRAHEGLKRGRAADDALVLQTDRRSWTDEQTDADGPPTMLWRCRQRRSWME
jgi:hypothetical protein